MPKRPQVQERLNMQIVQALQEALGTEDVACIIDAKHLMREFSWVSGDIASSTVTAEYGGRFKEESIKARVARLHSARHELRIINSKIQPGILRCPRHQRNR